jgi:dipeptide/tripeptide permease
MYSCTDKQTPSTKGDTVHSILNLLGITALVIALILVSQYAYALALGVAVIGVGLGAVGAILTPRKEETL